MAGADAMAMRPNILAPIIRTDEDAGMQTLRIFTILIALALAGGEIARWWGNPRFIPLAFDELLVAGAMFAAAALTKHIGAAPLAAAWALFAGLTLGLLVPTLDHLIFGPEKPSAVFYAVALGAMFTMGAISTWAALRINQAQSRAR